MAVAFKAALGNAASATSTGSLGVSITSPVAIGDLIVVRVAADNLSATTPTFTCADSGNTYTTLVQGAIQATAAAGVAGAIIVCKATVALVTNSTITVTFSGNVVQKAIYIESFTGCEATVRSTAVKATGSTSAAASPAYDLNCLGDLIIGAVAVESRAAPTYDSDTLGGSWTGNTNKPSTTSGSDTSAVGINGQYKIATMPIIGQAYNNTVATTDWVAMCVALVPTVGPQVTQASYRWYADGTETGSTALAAQDTSYAADVSAGDVNLHARIRLQNTNALAVPTTDDWQLQWNKGATAPPTLIDTYDTSHFQTTTKPLDKDQQMHVQSFLGNGTTLARFGAYMVRSGTPNGTLQAVLFAHTGTFGNSASRPTGNALAVSTTVVDCTSVSNASNAFVYFNFDETFTLVNGTAYFIGITTTNNISGGGNVGWQFDAASPSHGGIALDWTSNAWSVPTADFIFEVYGAAAGTWTNVAAGGTVNAFASANLTDAAATTNRLGAGTGTFVAGKISEDGLVDDLGWSASNYTEVLYSLTVKQADVADSDTLRLRVRRNGGPTGLIAQTPTLTVTKVLAAVTQAAYRWYDVGTETGSPALAAQNTAATGDVSVNDGIGQLRVLLQSTNVVNLPSTDDWQLQWEKNASGTWINVASTYPIIDSYPSSNFDGSLLLDPTGVAGIAQQFVGTGVAVARIGFWLTKGGTPNGTMTASIYASSAAFGNAAAVPTGTALVSSTPIATTILLVAPAMVYFSVTGFTPVNGTPYFVVLTSTNTATAAVFVGNDNTSPTHGGQGATLIGSTWSVHASDFIFEVDSPPVGVIPYDDPNLTDAAATTNRLTGGTGTFTAGKISETGLVTDAGWSGNNFTELVWSIDIVNSSVANGDTLRFRVLRNGATTTMTYTQVPTISVVRIVQATIATTFTFTATATTFAQVYFTSTTYAHPGIVLGTNSPMLDGTTPGWTLSALPRIPTATTAATQTVNSVNGPTAGLEFGGIAPVEFISMPLEADATISKPITATLACRQTNAAANMAIQVVIERVDSTGVIASEIGRTTNTANLTTASGTFVDLVITPTPTSMTAGDRFRVRVFFNDATSVGNMVAGGIGSFSYGFGSPSRLTFEDSFNFNQVEPAGTQLFLTDTASVAVSSDIEQEMWTTRGTPTATNVVAVTAGWSGANRWTDNTTNNTPIEWYTRALTAFTLNGLLRVSIRAQESSGARVALRAEIAVVNGDGSGAVVWGSSAFAWGAPTPGAPTSANSGELSTVSQAISGWLAGPATAVSDGQRLRLRVYADDCSNNPRVASTTATVTYNGAVATSGDSWIQLPQTVTEFVGGAGDATASPASIVTVTTHDATTTKADQTASPAAIVAATTHDATTAKVSQTSTPVAITAVTTHAAVTVRAGQTSTPVTIFTFTTHPAVTVTVVTNATSTPAAIFTFTSHPAVTASAVSAATPTPAAIQGVVFVNAVTVTTSGTRAPASIVTVVTMDAVTATGTKTAAPSPAAIVTTVFIEQTATRVSASRGPPAITAVVTMTLVTITVATTTAPAAIQTAVTMTLPTVTASGTRAPAATTTFVAMDAVAATGVSGGSRAPAAIVTFTVHDASTLHAGATSVPAAIQAVVFIDATATKTSGTRAPAAIVTFTTHDAVTPHAGQTTAPAAIFTFTTHTAVAASGNGSRAPATIVTFTTHTGVTASGSGTRNPATVVTFTTHDAATLHAGQSSLPAAIVAITTFDAATARAGQAALPAAIVTFTAHDAVVLHAGQKTLPAAIVTSVAMTLVTVTVTTTTTPAAIQTVVTMTLPTTTISGTRNPAATFTFVTMTAVFASGASGSTAAPAPIVAVVFSTGATLHAGQQVTPATIVTAVTMTNPTTAAGQDRSGSPATIFTSVFMTQAATLVSAARAPPTIITSTTMVLVVVTVAGVRSPAAVTTSTTHDPVFVKMGQTVSPAATFMFVTMPLVAAGSIASRTAQPAAIFCTVTMSLVTTSGQSNAAAAPAATFTSVTMVGATLHAGQTTSLATIVTTVSMSAAVAHAGATTFTAAIFVPVTMPSTVRTTGWTTSPSSLAVVVFMPDIGLSAGSTVIVSVGLITVTMWRPDIFIGAAPIVADPLTTAGYAGPRDTVGYKVNDQSTSGYSGPRRSEGYDRNELVTVPYIGRRHTEGY